MVILEPGKRRATACSNCKRRHLACYSLAEDDNWLRACVRCQKLKFVCDGHRTATIPLTANDIAELRSQVRRLDSWIRSLERSPDTQVDQLVSRLTSLCFTAEGLSGPDAHDETVLSSVQGALNDGYSIVDAQVMETGGFCYQAIPETSNIENLLEAMPEWNDMQTALIGLGRGRLICTEAVWSPQTARRIADIYDSGQPPAIDALAVIFAFMALYHGDQAVEHCATLGLSQEHANAAETYHLHTRDALKLGSCYQDPSHDALFAMWALSHKDLANWTNTSRWRRGLNALPVLLSLAWQLGYNEADDHFEGESAVEIWERRALASAIVRVAWRFMPTLGRQSAFCPASFRASPPDVPLSYQDSPFDEHFECFRATAGILRGVRLRTILAVKGMTLGTEVGDFDFARCKAFIEAANELYTEYAVDDWAMTMEDDARYHYVAHCATMDPKEAVARSYSFCNTSHLTMDLHAHFIMSPDPEQASWHRKGLVDSMRRFLVCLRDLDVVLSGWPSLCFAGYNSVISGTLILSSVYPNALTRQEEEVHRTLIDEATAIYYAHRSMSRLLPRPTVRLIRLMAYLLPQSDRRKTKRALNRVIKCAMPSILLAEDSGLTFSFASESGWPGYADLDEDLRRKSPRLESGSSG